MTLERWVTDQPGSSFCWEVPCWLLFVSHGASALLSSRPGSALPPFSPTPTADPSAAHPSPHGCSSRTALPNVAKRHKERKGRGEAQPAGEHAVDGGGHRGGRRGGLYADLRVCGLDGGRVRRWPELEPSPCSGSEGLHP